MHIGAKKNSNHPYFACTLMRFELVVTDHEKDLGVMVSSSKKTSTLHSEV